MSGVHDGVRMGSVFEENGGEGKKRRASEYWGKEEKCGREGIVLVEVEREVKYK